MGIKGLFPFLGKGQREVNIASFKGQTAAIDAYCWLHKGTYSCALELAMKTKKFEDLPFVKYCMKKVNLLRHHDVTPIVVFDGGSLPMKASTEKERRDRRKANLNKGKALYVEGKRSEALDYFRRCVDVTPEMALAFIKQLRREGVQAIVAPYEADAQLAYLVKEGIANFVITEDSDLLAFGCPRVFFKMDENGDGKFIELDSLGKMNKALVGFTPDSFRHLCILSGCDYLPSVHGIGLSKASKYLKRANKDPYRAIKSIKYEVGNVPPTYEEDFRKADMAFLYQLVFDPQTQKQVRLNAPPPEMDLSLLDCAGTSNSPSKQVGLARGNINPLTLEIMDNYSPSKNGSSSDTSHGKSGTTHGKGGTWNRPAMSSSIQYPVSKQTTITSSLTVSLKAKKDYKPPKKIEDTLDLITSDELVHLYSNATKSVSPNLSDIDTKPVNSPTYEPVNNQSPEQIDGATPKPVVRNKFAFSRNTVVKSKYFSRSSNNDDFSPSVSKSCGIGPSGVKDLAKEEKALKEEKCCDKENFGAVDVTVVAGTPESELQASARRGDMSARKRLFEEAQEIPSKKYKLSDSDEVELDDTDISESGITMELSQPENHFATSNDTIDSIDLTIIDEPTKPLTTPYPAKSEKRLPARTGLRVGLSKSYRKAKQCVPQGISKISSYFSYQQKPKMEH